MHDDLYTYLTATFAATFGARIYHMSLPQSVNTWPALTFQQISRSEEWRDMDAPAADKVDSVLYQFEIVAATSAVAIAAAAAFDSVFRDFRGTMSATNIQDVELTNETHLDDRDGDKLRRRVVLTYTLTFDV